MASRVGAHGRNFGIRERQCHLSRYRAAVSVLTNGEGAAATPIAQKIQALILAPESDPDARRDLDRARQIFLSLQEGNLDRSLLDADTNVYFNEQAIADFAASLKPLGPPSNFSQATTLKRGGMTYRTFTVKTKDKTVRVAIFVLPDGKIAQYLVVPQ